MKFLSKFALLFFLVLASCSSSSDDDSGSTSIDPEEAKNFETLCGIIEDLVLSVRPNTLERVQVSPIGSDTVIITRTEGAQAGQSQLVKLHGVTSDGVDSLRILHGLDVLNTRLADGGFFVAPDDDCEFVSNGGGSGVVGQIFSLDGESMSELMLQQGSVVAVADVCDPGSLKSCYDTIQPVSRFPSRIELDYQSVSFPNRCGVVEEGQVVNPVTSAELVSVEALESDRVLVTRLLGVEQGNSQIVQLQGLTNEGVSISRQLLGKNLIETLSGAESYLVVEDFGCTVTEVDGGQGVNGSLFARDGTSINEQLLAEGYALPDSVHCSSGFLSECYSIIAAEAPEEVIPPTTDPDAPDSSDSVIDNFLWKPVSERNGNLVVLVNPVDVRVVVIGNIQETLTDFGPSNGRGTTARGSRPGCSYGSNVTVEFFNSAGERIPLKDGRTSVNISDGCRRVEFRL